MVGARSQPNHPYLLPNLTVNAAGMSSTRRTQCGAADENGSQLPHSTAWRNLLEPGENRFKTPRPTVQHFNSSNVQAPPYWRRNQGSLCTSTLTLHQPSTSQATSLEATGVSAPGCFIIDLGSPWVVASRNTAQCPTNLWAFGVFETPCSAADMDTDFGLPSCGILQMTCRTLATQPASLSCGCLWLRRPNRATSNPKPKLQRSLMDLQLEAWPPFIEAWCVPVWESVGFQPESSA